MALGKVIQRIEIEMSGGTKQYMVSAKQGDRAHAQSPSIMGNRTRSRQDPASQLSSENQIDTGYIHRVNSRTML